jgi:predicted nucleic acid-binding protein
MIVLDANVVSEPLKVNGSLLVQAWLDRQIADTLYLTTRSLSELLVGIKILPEGKRRDGLNKALTDLVDRLFGGRIIPFGENAAVMYATVYSLAHAAGHNISVGDGQIAAIAAEHRFTVATRYTTPFLAAGVPVINPWEV